MYLVAIFSYRNYIIEGGGRRISLKLIKQNIEATQNEEAKTALIKLKTGYLVSLTFLYLTILLIFTNIYLENTQA